MRRCLLAGLMLTPSIAQAEPVPEPPPKLAILAGAGLRNLWLLPDGAGRTKDPAHLVPTLEATVAYRVWPKLSFGVHLGAGFSRDQDSSSGTQDFDDNHWNTMAVDLGFALQYEDGRYAVSPWIGGRFSRFHEADTHFFRGMPTTTEITEWTADSPSFGVTASIAVTKDIPIAIFLDLQTTTRDTVLGPKDGPLFHYSAASLGVAYHR